MITTGKRKLSRSSAKIRASGVFGRSAIVAWSWEWHPCSSAPIAQLYTFQHGFKSLGGNVDGMQGGGNITETGWVHGQQETLVLGDDEAYNHNHPRRI
jgi:hypothetical protein